MYKNDQTVKHKRDSRGRIVQQEPQRKRSSSGFFTALGTAMAIALVLTGLLLYTSIQQNEVNIARLQNLEQENAILRSNSQIFDVDNQGSNDIV